ncbi:fimbrial assembly family protein [Caballeronia sp. LZ062]|uniref:PilN domain-containing protein n=1 Tax=unclassified Caballeronia TaxID=2646786 RepID=UPI00285EADD0|nr:MULTISPECIES: fimbrial assembly family protein [unclassified Caballeronia]MDR5855601.1 fimbrial assembly family protein [Caballeronia sp. LZ050]MDR5872611.1 fimbrial assembly family protein [Caballeronia sp. LZ062]
MTSVATVEGFNLLPHRARRRRSLRRQRFAILAAAGLAGCAAVGGVVGWDAFQQARLDDRRIALETTLRASSAHIDEHARLLRTEAERRRAREAAQPLAGPRDRFLALLDALAEAPAPGDVALQRVTQRADEVELAALAPDSQMAARWLKRLEALRGVQSVEVVEMKRRAETVAPGRRETVASRDSAAERYEFTALVRYASADGTTRPARPAGAKASTERRTR